MLQPMADWGTIAGAALTLCQVVVVYMAPLAPVYLAVHTTRSEHQVLGWILMAMFVPFAVLYIGIDHLAQKEAF